MKTLRSRNRHATIEPFDLVIFGGSGDLTMRKLLPSLYYHHCDGLLPAAGRILGVARTPWTRGDFIATATESARQNIASEAFDETLWQGFAERLDYLPLDATQPDSFEGLKAVLDQHPDRQRVFYLSTGSNLFVPICQQLGRLGLNHPGSRLAIEKPLGRDLESAKAINQRVGAVFDEAHIYRIDHYLGKEPVQNMLALRFGNTLFEPLWQRSHVRDVQITVAEHIGVEGRGEFYDDTGALRDMVQNHLLQLLCIVAMEPPTHHTPEAVRDEKLKVLGALRPLRDRDALTHTVRGQYRAGAINGTVVLGYDDEPGVRPDSRTETFVALKAFVDNWRWAGVPFYLRTGKRMQERVTEVIINFESLPHALFDTADRAMNPNKLVIRLQPEEYIRLFIRAKVPGDGMVLRPVQLNLDLKEAHKERQRSAYERLLIDLLRGQQILFLRYDELEAAWRWIDPILAAWADSDDYLSRYPAGTWGPTAASRLIYEGGGQWYEES
ncbi:MAG: glucose-6-phosphate dehydrogenase [Candidatus Competibacterales bacterium]